MFPELIQEYAQEMNKTALYFWPWLTAGAILFSLGVVELRREPNRPIKS